jgi:hypothetical protein
MRLLLIPLCTVLCFAAHAAEIYKWTDAKGRTHYSDRPPPAQVESERRSIAGEPERPAETPAEVANKEAAARCEAARRSLQQLRENTNVAMDLDGDGTPETLDATAREEQILAMQRNVEQLCAPPKPANGA